MGVRTHVVVEMVFVLYCFSSLLGKSTPIEIELSHCLKSIPDRSSISREPCWDNALASDCVYDRFCEPHAHRRVAWCA